MEWTFSRLAARGGNGCFSRGESAVSDLTYAAHTAGIFNIERALQRKVREPLRRCAGIDGEGRRYQRRRWPLALPRTCSLSRGYQIANQVRIPGENTVRCF